MLTDAEIGKIKRRAYERKVFGWEETMLTAILCNCNDKGECRRSNQDFIKQLGVSDRSISGWLAKLKEKRLIGICINSHTHTRIIYVRGLEGKYQSPETYDDLSPEQKIFHEMFPNKRIDCEVPKDIDFYALLEKIKQSDWLQHNSDNMSLKSFVKTCYKRIMNDEFSNQNMRKKFGPNFSTGRKYTKEEMNALFQDIDEIEV